MNIPEGDWHETACPRCGTDAQWSFLDSEKTTVEVMCPDCGRFEMSREQFDTAVVEKSESTNRESAT